MERHQLFNYLPASALVVTTIFLVFPGSSEVNAKRVAVINLKQLQDAVQAKDPKAMLELVPIYRYGQYGVVKDIEKSIDLLRRAAELGSHEAQYKYARELGALPLVDPRQRTARAWLNRAVEAGHEDATYMLANHHVNAKPLSPTRFGIARNIPRAFELYRTCAERGSVSCNNSLSYNYAKGNHVRKNLKTAFRFAKSAVDATNADTDYLVAGFAMVTLADMYGNGRGTTENLQKALALHKRAASIGYRDSVRFLSQAYLRSIGVKRDLSTAVDYALASEFFNVSERMLSRDLFRPLISGIQRRLRAQGHYSGSIDSRVGPATLVGLQKLRKSSYGAFAIFRRLKIGYSSGMWGITKGDKKHAHELVYHDKNISLAFICPVTPSADKWPEIGHIRVKSRDEKNLPFAAINFTESLLAKSPSTNSTLFSHMLSEDERDKQGRVSEGTFADCDIQKEAHQTMLELGKIFDKQWTAYMSTQDAKWRYQISKPSVSNLFTEFFGMCRPATVQACRENRLRRKKDEL